MTATELPINRYLDHAILKPQMNQAEVREAIALGIRHQVFTVCVMPPDIALAVQMCAGTETAVSCVLAFPHGQALPQIKTAEAERYQELGTSEIDMVVNYGLIRSADWMGLRADIEAVTRVARVPVKTILETSQLTPAEIAEATRVAADAGATFVKTSTGFTGEGATPEAVRTMLEAAAGRVQVKASGGIRDYQTARMYVEMGCTRIGNGYSATEAIVTHGAATGTDTY